MYMINPGNVGENINSHEAFKEEKTDGKEKHNDGWWEEDSVMKKIRKKICIVLFCAMITSMFCVVDVNATVYEVEPNDSIYTATPICFDDLVIGITRNRSGDYYDYFSFESIKGHYYRFYLYDAVSFLSGTTLIELINPAGKGSTINYDIKYDESIKSHYLDFYTNYSGKYYFKFYNSSNVVYGFMLHEHNLATNASKDATCTESGKTEGCYCNNCGAVLKAQEIIPATGHKEVVDAAVSATCTQPGKTQGSHCSVCGDVIKAQEVIPATGQHTYESWTTVKVATVFANGEREHSCTVCGESETESIPKLKATVKLSATKKTVRRNKTYTLKITKLAKGDSVKSVKSSKKGVATVKKVKTNRYKITGKKKGTATITVVLKSGKKAICKVTVK